LCGSFDDEAAAVPDVPSWAPLIDKLANLFVVSSMNNKMLFCGEDEVNWIVRKCVRIV
jgi:hypothetical protein